MLAVNSIFDELSCETEVYDLDYMVIDHKVIRFDVSVNIVQVVHLFEGSQHLQGNLH